MGKAVPQNIKSKANILLHAYPDEDFSNFETAKRFIDSFHTRLSKLQRNLVAGFIVRQKAKQKQA